MIRVIRLDRSGRQRNRGVKFAYQIRRHRLFADFRVTHLGGHRRQGLRGGTGAGVLRRGSGLGEFSLQRSLALSEGLSVWRVVERRSHVIGDRAERLLTADGGVGDRAEFGEERRVRDPIARHRDRRGGSRPAVETGPDQSEHDEDDETTHRSMLPSANYSSADSATNSLSNPSNAPGDVSRSCSSTRNSLDPSSYAREPCRRRTRSC